MAATDIQRKNRHVLITSKRNMPKFWKMLFSLRRSIKKLNLTVTKWTLDSGKQISSLTAQQFCLILKDKRTPNESANSFPTCKQLANNLPTYIRSRRSSQGAGVAQLVSARLSEQEVPGSILGDFNVCFDFPLICVAIASNTRKT